jgi:predicted Zn finger-like uncharacterized protein
MLWYLPSLRMNINCDQCGAKFKVKSKKRPGETAVFKCGKCDNRIRVEIKDVPEKSADKISASSKTVKVECDACKNTFVKPVTEKDNTCYQCRIDSLVNKIKDKYGVEGQAAPEADSSSSKYTIRSADGLILGPIKLRTVKVLAREKKIRGLEEVSKNEAEFIPLMHLPELAELFPDMKEIMDTSGLDDKVDEAFSAAFVEDEQVQEPVIGEDDKPETKQEEQKAEADEEETPEEDKPSDDTIDLSDLTPADDDDADQKTDDEEEKPDEEAGLSSDEEVGEQPEPDIIPEKDPEEDLPEPEIIEPSETQEVDDEYLIDFNSASDKENVEEKEDGGEKTEAAEDVGTEFSFADDEEDTGPDDEENEDEIIEGLEPLPDVTEDSKYRIRYPDGLILGPVKLNTIVELYGDGNLTGQEDIQRENEDWLSFSDLPELAVLLDEADDDDVVELTEVLEEPV